MKAKSFPLFIDRQSLAFHLSTHTQTRKEQQVYRQDFINGSAHEPFKCR